MWGCVDVGAWSQRTDELQIGLAIAARRDRTLLLAIGGTSVLVSMHLTGTRSSGKMFAVCSLLFSVGNPRLTDKHTR